MNLDMVLLGITKNSSVYSISHKILNKQYIGSAANTINLIRQHIHQLKGFRPQDSLHNLANQHGGVSIL